MTSGTQVAVLAPLGHDAGPVRRAARAGDRPLVRLTAFAALGLYGVLRWATLMKPAPTGRLLGLLALALVLAGAGPMLLERERAVAARRGHGEPPSALGAPLAVLAVLAMFPIAGVPLAWTLHLRVAVTADGIGQGLSALPGILVPYSGINAWARVVILLGAAILLLDAAMLLAFAPSSLGDARRGAAALPLIALVIVPATLVHPHLAYLHGLVLFALLAFFMWGERVPADRRGGVVLACAVTGAIGMIVAPALDEHSAWIDYQALTRGFTPAHVERFDWAQRYGPLNWPRTGNVVLDVNATPKVWSGEYWKAENLDTFDGRGWSAGGPGAGELAPPLDPAAVARWTQSLTVTVRAMQSTQLIAAGSALEPPQHLAAPPVPGSSTGTYVSQSRLGPGDTYAVKVYAPDPSAARLAREEPVYPVNELRGDMALTLPQSSGRRAPKTVLFAPFGSRRVPTDLTNPDAVDGPAAIKASPYADVYTLAQRLARTAPTPFAYVQRVQRYLGRDPFSYDEYPPPTQYPLATFLLRNYIGYCQQFAGSMALLLRMGGVPARVATGFTTGTYDAATKRWLVTDVDAHAWVEAWFPHYGWVTFDPTPAAAPARGGRAPIGSSTLLGGNEGNAQGGIRHADTGPAGASGAVHAHSGGSTAPILFGLLGLLVALLAAALVAWTRSGPLDADGLLGELERALARSGRPISDGVTLAGLERRFRTSPQAAGYVRALRMARFAGDGVLPTPSQRRALRAQLRAGLGLAGAVRALWALPPRPKRAPWRRRRTA